MNHIGIVGRLEEVVELKTTEDGETKGIITVAVPRNFKNSEGTYETDFIDIVVQNDVAIYIAECC